MKVNEGLPPVAAALEAARLRFRPISMTSLAFILGVVPLAFSTGADAAARQSIGTDAGRFQRADEAARARLCRLRPTGAACLRAFTQR